MTKYNPDKHHRRSVRLQGYDYAQNGAYFVTICAYNREYVFGEIVGETMRLNASGEIVQEEWLRTPLIRPEVELDIFVVMPNHFHGIVVIRDDVVGAHGRAPLQPTVQSGSLHRAPKSLSSLMAGFKSAATKHINELRDTPGAPVWQRSFYDRIIRNEEGLNKARQYIENNPARWAYDEENPLNIRS
jgi:REP element-mobilizing transposase RayT